MCVIAASPPQSLLEPVKPLGPGQRDMRTAHAHISQAPVYLTMFGGWKEKCAWAFFLQNDDTNKT